MKFDYGNILTRSGQIIWKHKSLWALLTLPMVAAFLPFMLLLFLFLAALGVTKGHISENTFMVFGIAFFLLFIISTLVNFLASSLVNAAVTLGIVRAERGEGSTKFMDLLKDGAVYFWRVLGLMLATNLTIGLAFTIFNLLMLVLILVTIGMASICVQPIMLLLMPFSFLLVGALEAAEIAIIFEGKSVIDAIKRALQVVRANLWKYMAISAIVYFGSSILSSMIMTPLFAPIFILPFLLEAGRGISLTGVVLPIGLFSCIFFPVMILVSGTLGVFMKTSLNLTYLRLADPVEN